VFIKLFSTVYLATAFLLIQTSAVFAFVDAKDYQLKEHKVKDPTKPPSVIVQQLAKEIKPKNELKLSAIFKRQNKLYAVINGEIFSAGEKLEGVDVDMKVEEIDAGTVVLKSLGQDELTTKLTVDEQAQISKQVVK